MHEHIRFDNSINQIYYTNYQRGLTIPLLFKNNILSNSNIMDQMTIVILDADYLVSKRYSDIAFI